MRNCLLFFKGLLTCAILLLWSLVVTGTTITVTNNMSWSVLTGGTGGGLPTAADNIIVTNGKTLTVDVSSGVCASIQLGGTGTNAGNGTLTFNANSQVTVSGIVTIGANTLRGGSIVMTNGGTLIAQGFTVTNGNTWTPGAGTVQLSASNTLPGTFLTSFNNLTTTGGTTTLGVGITINGALTIGSGTTLDVSASNFGIAANGTWVNNGSASTSFTARAGTVTFGGSAAQTIGGSIATTFYNATISNSSGVTLNYSEIVSNTLMLTNGLLTLGSYNLTISTATTISGGSATTYVQTNSTGQLLQTVSGAQVTYPVGNSYFDPLKITNTGTSGVFGVNVTDGTPPSPWDASKVVNASWVVSEATAGGKLLLNAQWVSPTQEASNFAAGTTPEFGMWNGTSWSQYGATQSSNTFSTGTNAFTLATAGTYTFAVGKDDCFIGAAATYYSVGTTLNLTSSWNTAADASGTPPGDFAAQQQTFIIQNTAGLTANWNVSGTGSVVTVGNGTTTLNFTAGNTATSTGYNFTAPTVNIVANATLSTLGTGLLTTPSLNISANGTLYLAGSSSPSITSAILNPMSTVNYASTSAQSIGVFTYGNLIISNTASATAAGGLTIAGSVSIAAGATFKGGNLTHTVAGNWANSGTYTPNKSTINFNGSASQTISGSTTFYNLTVTNSANMNLANGSLIYISNNFAPSSTSFNSVTGSTISFNGTGQTIPAFNYYNLTNTANISFASATIGIAGMFSPVATYTVAGSTVAFNGSAAQSIPSFTFNNLTISNTSASGTTASGALTIGGSVLISSGSTFVGGNYTHNVAGNWTNSGGTYTPGTGIVNFNGASTQTITGTTTFYTLTVTNTATNMSLANGSLTYIAGIFTPNGTSFGSISGSTVFFNGTGQTIPAFNYYNLANSNNISLAGSGSIGVEGAFVVTVGTTFNVSGSTVLFNAQSTDPNQRIPVIVSTDLSGTNSGGYNNLYISSAVPTFFPYAPTSTIADTTINVFGTLTYSGSGGLYLNSSTTTNNINTFNIGSFLNTAASTGVIFTGGNTGPTGSAAGTSNIYVTGGFLSYGTTLYTKGSGANTTVNFVGTSPQQFVCASSNQVNFTVSSTAVVNMTGGAVIGSAQAKNPVYFTVNGTLNCGTNIVSLYTLSGAYTYFVLSSGATLGIGSIYGITSTVAPGATAGNIQMTANNATAPFYTSYSSGANYVYNGTSAQATGIFTTFNNATAAMTAVPTVNNLYVENASGVTLSQATVLKGLYIGNIGTATNVTQVNSSVFYDGGNVITAGSGTSLNLGTTPYVPVATITNASQFILGSATTATTYAAFATSNIGAGTTVQYNTGNGVDQTVSATPSYYNLAIVNSTGSGSSTKTLGGSLTVYGKLTIDGFSKLTAVNGANNYNITIGGSWLNSGTFTPGTGTVTFNGSSSNSSQIESSTQLLAGNGSTGAFYNLTHNNSYTVQLITSPLSTANTFINSAGTFAGNALAHTVTGLATVSGGTYTAGTGIQTFNGGLTVSGGTFDASGTSGIGGSTIVQTGASNSITVSGGTFTGIDSKNLASSVSATNVGLSSGTLTAPSGLFSVTGNWAQSGGTFAPGTYTVTFALASGTQTISTGTGSPVANSAFNNINHTGAGILQIAIGGAAVTTNGTFTNASGAGNFDANGQAHTVGTQATITGGAYLAKTGTQTFNGGGLTINGGTLTGSTGSVATTNLTLSSGPLTAPSGPFSVSGNWAYNGGTFTPGTYTVTFNGASASVAQIIGGALTTPFYSLTMNNTGTGATTIDPSHAGISKSVSSALTLTKGLITTDAADLLVLGASATSSLGTPTVGGSYYSSTSYVNGPLQKVGSTAFTFPVGKSNGYEPITIGAMSDNSVQTYTAEYIRQSAETMARSAWARHNWCASAAATTGGWHLNTSSPYVGTYVANPSSNHSLGAGVSTTITMYWNPNNPCQNPNAPAGSENYVTNVNNPPAAPHDRPPGLRERAVVQRIVDIDAGLSELQRLQHERQWQHLLHGGRHELQPVLAGLYQWQRQPAADQAALFHSSEDGWLQPVGMEGRMHFGLGQLCARKVFGRCAIWHN